VAVAVQKWQRRPEPTPCPLDNRFRSKKAGVTEMADSEPNHPVWESAFNEATRQEQMEDDSTAWHIVTGLLLAIVSMGVLLAIFTVWISA